jgi:hypothetical protein
MAEALQHLVLLILAGCACLVGRYMTRRPEAIVRAITLGGPMFGQRFGVAFFRVVGWVFTVVFGLGSLMYAILISLDIFHHR